MSLVQGFLNRVQKYLDKGIISSYTHFGNKVGNSFKLFMDGIFEMMEFSESCFVTMAVYFDRLISRHHEFVNEKNMTRLIFICAVLAIKMTNDFSEKNSYFAKISGITNREIKCLEVSILQWIDYSLVIGEKEYYKYYQGLSSFIL